MYLLIKFMRDKQKSILALNGATILPSFQILAYLADNSSTLTKEQCLPFWDFFFSICEMILKLYSIHIQFTKNSLS